ncbi:two-component sensor histidine kinase [Actinorhabdospora filicis]|uniref:histidine kinase n=1 Tax=Actinorhabdospora filicis TaxID=1785913 RepID=A0A9W6WBV9_9ACTN|nr:histidine kinase [Actinorhabdospora filicis]GLZ79971.1 two-component sensor histidine kinase [Actinorhabdospora filicis]
MSFARRVPPLVKWCLYVLLPAGFLLLLSRNPDNTHLVLRLATFLLPAGLLRRWPLPALALMIATAFAWGRSGDWTAPFLYLLIIQICVGYVAATRRPLVSLSAAGGVLLIEVLAGLGMLAPNSKAMGEPFALLFVPLLSVTAWIIGSAVRQRRALTATLRDKAVTDERLRIARELHDMISHSIGVIAIQAGVGGRVIDTQPEEARKSLATIETTSRETLAQLRRTLGSLRRGDARPAEFAPAPGLGDLPRLAESTAAAGVTVGIDVRGERGEVPEDIDLSAYRIVQESLTNVVKHARVDACRVTVEYTPTALTLEITDEGRGGGLGEEGYGLTGMRERVTMLGGEFSAGPRPESGFGVRAVLPLPA